MIALGKTEKMIIIAYKNSAFTGPEVGRYTFIVNPESYNHHYQVELVPTKEGGGDKALVYFGAQPAELEFEILMDGTGVINDGDALNIQLLGRIKDVKVVDQVNDLLKLCIEADGTISQNNYLKVIWGDKGEKAENTVFKGKMQSLDLNYKLFKPDGTPLRVIAKLKLIEAAGKRENPFKSSEITSQKVVESHDTISLLANQVYDDPKYYLDLAQKNSLNSFRKVKPGSKMNFPPLT